MSRDIKQADRSSLPGILFRQCMNCIRFQSSLQILTWENQNLIRIFPPTEWITREPGIRIYYAKRKSLRGSLIKNLIESEKPDFIYLNSMYSFRFSIIPLISVVERKNKRADHFVTKGYASRISHKIEINKEEIIHLPAEPVTDSDRKFIFTQRTNRRKKIFTDYFP